MAITTHQLRAEIIGDDSNFRGTYQRYTQSLAQLEAQTTRTTALINSSFQSAGASIGPSITAPINQAAQSFGTIGSSAQASFNVAAQAGQSAGQAIQSSMAGVNPAIASVASNAQSMGASVANSASQATSSIAPIGAVAQQAGQAVNAAAGTAFAGLNQLGQGAIAAGGAVTTLGSAGIDAAQRLVQVRSSLDVVNSALKEEQAILSGQKQYFEQAMGSGAQATAAQYAGKIKETENNIAALLVQQSSLTNQSKALTGQLRESTNVQQSFNFAQGTASTTINTTTGFLARLKDGLSQTTNQITSQGTVWQGYDRVVTSVLQGVLGPGGLTVGFSLLITIIGSLAGKILNLGDAKKEDIKLSQESLSIETLRIALMHQQADANVSVTTSTYGIIAAQKEAFNAIFSKAIGEVITKQKELDDIQKKITDTTNTLTNVQHQSTTALGAYNQRATATNQLSGEQQKVVESLRETFKSLGGQYAETQKELSPLVQGILDYKNISQVTTDEIIRQASVFVKDAESLDALKRALEGATPALDQAAKSAAEVTSHFERMVIGATKLNAQIANIKAPDPSIVGTLQGIENTSKTLGESLEISKNKFKDWGSVAASVRPDAEATNKALKTYAEFHATGADKAHLSASALSIYQAQLSQLPPEQQKAIQALKDSALAADAFSTTIKKVKEELDKNSPFIGERAFAMPTESVDKAIQNFGARIGPALGAIQEDAKTSFAKWWDEVAANVGKSTGVGKGFFSSPTSA